MAVIMGRTLVIVGVCSWLICAVLYLWFAPDSPPGLLIINHSGQKAKIATEGAPTTLAHTEMADFAFPLRTQTIVVDADGAKHQYTWISIRDHRQFMSQKGQRRFYMQLEKDSKLYLLKPVDGPVKPAVAFPPQPPGYPLLPELPGPKDG